MASNVQKQGYLWKKSPAGLKGFRQWQKRWFELTEKSLNYYSAQGDKKALGIVPLHQILEAVYLPTKRIGCRLDVRVKSLRVYSLHGVDGSDAMAWTSAVNDAVVRAKRLDLGPAKRRKDDDAIKLTKLQALMLKYKFGESARRTAAEEDQLAQAIVEKCPDDATLLKFLLHQIISPKDAGFFDYDMSDDEKEQRNPAYAALAAQQSTNSMSPFSSGASSASSASSALSSSLLSSDSVDGEKELSCVFPRCTNLVIRNMRWCNIHVNDVSNLRDEDAARMVAMLRSQEFTRVLRDSFASIEGKTTEELLSQNYALRILYLVMRGIYVPKEAALQFFRSIEILCTGQQFHKHIKVALLSILLSSPADVPQNVDQPLTVAFYMPVKQRHLWLSIFAVMKASPMGIRKETLEDINTILHDSFKNVETLACNDNWQSMVYELLTDLPKTRPEGHVSKEVFGYSINIPTQVFFQYFFKGDGNLFHVILMDSLLKLHQFGDSTSEGMEIASTLLGALCSRLASQTRLFSQSEKTANEWRNLMVLTRIIRKFIFTSSYWQTNAKIVEEALIDEISNNAANTIIPEETEADHEGETGEEESYHHSTTRPASPVNSNPNNNGNVTTSSSQTIRLAALQREGALVVRESEAKAQLLKVHASIRNDSVDGEFALYKCRFGRDRRVFSDGAETRLADYGVHFDSGDEKEGKAYDLNLVQKLAALLKALKLDDFNPALNPNMFKEEKEYLVTAQKEYEFWLDAHTFLQSVSKSDLDRKFLTYRRLSFLTQDFVNAHYSKSDRAAAIKELQKVIKKANSNYQADSDDNDNKEVSIINLGRTASSNLHTPNIQPHTTSQSSTPSNSGRYPAVYKTSSSINSPPLSATSTAPATGSANASGAFPPAFSFGHQTATPSSASASASASFTASISAGASAASGSSKLHSHTSSIGAMPASTREAQHVWTTKDGRSNDASAYITVKREAPPPLPLHALFGGSADESPSHSHAGSPVLVGSPVLAAIPRPSSAFGDHILPRATKPSASTSATASPAFLPLASAYSISPPPSARAQSSVTVSVGITSAAVSAANSANASPVTSGQNSPSNASLNAPPGNSPPRSTPRAVGAARPPPTPGSSMPHSPPPPVPRSASINTPAHGPPPLNSLTNPSPRSPPRTLQKLSLSPTLSAAPIHNASIPGSAVSVHANAVALNVTSAAIESGTVSNSFSTTNTPSLQSTPVISSPALAASSPLPLPLSSSSVPPSAERSNFNLALSSALQARQKKASVGVPLIPIPNSPIPPLSSTVPLPSPALTPLSPKLSTSTATTITTAASLAQSLPVTPTLSGANTPNLGSQTPLSQIASPRSQRGSNMYGFALPSPSTPNAQIQNNTNTTLTPLGGASTPTAVSSPAVPTVNVPASNGEVPPPPASPPPPLKAVWTQVKDASTGKFYWWNKSTGRTQWKQPANLYE